MRDFYEEQLNELHTQMIAMGGLCEKAISNATKALTDGDLQLAEEIMKNDAIINRQERDIESLCMKLILHQQPVAGDLRRVSAAMKMVTDMERIRRPGGRYRRHRHRHEREAARPVFTYL